MNASSNDQDTPNPGTSGAIRSHNGVGRIVIESSASGGLRTKISLTGGGNATASSSSAAIKNLAEIRQNILQNQFYLLRSQLPGKSPLNGSIDLLQSYELADSLVSLRKIKEELSGFLPNLTGTSTDRPGHADGSSLKLLLEKPPIMKEILPLSATQLQGFKLQPGSVRDDYRQLLAMHQNQSEQQKRHHKKKREKHAGDEESSPSEVEEKTVVSSSSKRAKKETGEERSGESKKKKKKEKKKKKHARESESDYNPQTPSDSMF